jgi:hypothetical protein
MTTEQVTTVSTPAGPVNYDPVPPGSTHLDGGLRVCWMTTETNCLSCCVATLFDCDYSEVPAGPAGDHTKLEELQVLEEFHAWVRSRGYRTRYVEIGRELFNRLWIGVSCDPRPGWDHTVVCRGRTLVHDPSLGYPVPAGYMVDPVHELHYAIVFDRLEER